jgi:hypothetical protein
MSDVPPILFDSPFAIAWNNDGHLFQQAKLTADGPAQKKPKPGQEYQCTFKKGQKPRCVPCGQIGQPKCQY